MEQYISKSAVIAEIEKRKINIKEYCLQEGHDARFDVVPEQLSHILSFLNTLEVKKVDLEKEVIVYMDNEMKFLPNEVGYDTLLTIAKHFFELGLKAQKGE